MDDHIITVYCLCDDVLKAFHHREDTQCQMSDAEVLTTALVAALYFRGNFESARALLREQAYIFQCAITIEFPAPRSITPKTIVVIKPVRNATFIA